MKKAFGLLLLTSVLFGCGGGGSSDPVSDGHTGTGNGQLDNSNDQTGNGDNLVDPQNHLEHPWVYAYDDEAGISDTLFGVVYDKHFYGSAENSYAYGDIYEQTLPNGQLVMNLYVKTNNGLFNPSLFKRSDSLYEGAHQMGLGTSTLVKYSSVGRTQATMDDEWKTSNGTVFTIDATGAFSVVHDETGCLLEATVTMVADGVYAIDGKATACIDGVHNGDFKGMGSVPININVMGEWTKAFSSILLLNEETTAVEYFPFYIQTN